MLLVKKWKIRIYTNEYVKFREAMGKESKHSFLGEMNFYVMNISILLNVTSVPWSHHVTSEQ